MMDTTLLIELTDTVTVCHSTTSEDLLAQLAHAGGVLARKAKRAGRLHGEVEIEHLRADTYLLTWKDTAPVSDEPIKPDPHFINSSSGTSPGSGFYGSRETINGVDVRLERDCATHHLVASEVREVMEYRLKCVQAEIEALPDTPEGVIHVTALAAVKFEYQWFLKLLDGPLRT